VRNIASFNLVTFIGYAGGESELRKTPTGTSVTDFRLAVHTYTGKDQDGNPTDSAMWLTIVCWKDLAEQVSKLIKKGSLVFVNGKLAIREYTDTENVKHTKVEVVAVNGFVIG
jgi:single-strand DNA-binding protein